MDLKAIMAPCLATANEGLEAISAGHSTMGASQRKQTQAEFWGKN